jgi:CRISPR/Cas system CSM-associated protein Csm4 (group 5 of RAMP superfamily)
MAADYATMDEATNGAAMILDKPWAPAVIVARPRWFEKKKMKKISFFAKNHLQSVIDGV